MIDHLSLPVSDMARSRPFYDAVLAALGHARLMDMEEADYVASGYGPAGTHEPPFWIGGLKGGETRPMTPLDGQHIAFACSDRAAVDAFHAAGLAQGGRDNGAPGLRPEYHQHYYASFVIDPDGHHLEAVCHHPA